MANYKTEYPAAVILENNQISPLTIDDNRARVLITETESTVDVLTQIFLNEGFFQTMVEEKKLGQLCDGFRKHLSPEWDMHVRFLGLNPHKIAIDAEVETSTEYIQHLTKPEYWVSVLFEVHEILRKHKISFKTWHKKAKSHVMSFIENTTLELVETDGKIKWKPIAATMAIAIAIGLLLSILLKK